MMVYVRSLTVSSVRPSFTLFSLLYELLDNGMGEHRVDGPFDSILLFPLVL